MKTVGVIGGLGPEATVDFFAKVLRLTAVEQEQDHLHLIIDNNPQVPNRNDAIAGTGPSAAPELARMARRLQDAGADLLVMPCNTAHAFEDAIRAAVTIPLLSIIGAACSAAIALAPTAAAVGVLATDGSRKAGLFDACLRRMNREIRLLDDADQAEFMSLVYRLKRGERGETATRSMRGLIARLVDAGAGVVIAGCTEVPLVVRAGDVAVPLVDSTEELAVCCIESAGARVMRGFKNV